MIKRRRFACLALSAACLVAAPSKRPLSAVQRDTVAIANARQLQRWMVEAYWKAMKAGLDAHADTFFKVMAAGTPQPGKSLHPEIRTRRNPWARTPGASDTAFAPLIMIMDRQSNPSLTEIVRAETFGEPIGQAIGHFCPRRADDHTPASILTAVRLGEDPSQVVVRETVLDESANDRLIEARVRAFHRQVQVRYRRVKAAGLPLGHWWEVQRFLLGTSETHTEVPAYWTFRNPWRRSSRAFQGGEIVQPDPQRYPEFPSSIYGFDHLGEITVAYRPAIPGHGPRLLTAAFLFTPCMDPEGKETHILQMETELEPAVAEAAEHD